MGKQKIQVKEVYSVLHFSLGATVIFFLKKVVLYFKKKLLKGLYHAVLGYNSRSDDGDGDGDGNENIKKQQKGL